MSGSAPPASDRGPARARRRLAGRAASPTLVAVLGLALVVRIAVVAATPHYRPAYDAADYDRHARSIAAGLGYPASALAAPGSPSAFRPPGYPYLLAGVYRLTSDSVTAGRLVNLALGVLAVALVYAIAARVADRRVAGVAAGLTAVLPALVVLNATLLGESLFLALELAAVVAMLALRRSAGRPALAALTGALCGAAALVRPIGLVLLVPALIALWRSGPRRRFVATALLVLCAAAVMAPWTVRNYRAFGRFVPLSTEAGYTAAGTYNPSSLGAGGLRAPWIAPTRVASLRELFGRPHTNEAQVDDALTRRAVDLALDHPGYLPTVLGVNAARLVGVREPSTQRAEMNLGAAAATAVAACTLLLLALALAAVVGVARGRWRVAAPAWVWLGPALVVASVLPVVANPRYLAPAEPFLAILAAVAIVGALGRPPGAARRGL